MKLEITYVETVHHSRTIEIDVEDDGNYEEIEAKLNSFLAHETPSESYDSMKNTTEKTYTEWTTRSGTNCFIES